MKIFNFISDLASSISKIFVGAGTKVVTIFLGVVGLSVAGALISSSPHAPASTEVTLGEEGSSRAPASAASPYGRPLPQPIFQGQNSSQRSPGSSRDDTSPQASRDSGATGSNAGVAADDPGVPGAMPPQFSPPANVAPRAAAAGAGAEAPKPPAAPPGPSAGDLGGGGSDSSTSTSTSTGTTPSVATIDTSSLSLAASATGTPGLCQKVTVGFLDTFGVATTANGTSLINVSASVGSVFSDAACLTLATTVTVASGAISGQFFYKATVVGAATVQATNSSLRSASTVITTGKLAAIVALGQPDMSTITSNTGGLVTSQTMDLPFNPLRAGNRLFVTDEFNRRVLVWNSVPVSTGQAPDLVLGQPNFSTSNQNTGGISGATVSGPHNVFSDGQRLFVADYGNNRVLIWNSIPTTNGKAADVVLGQPNMTASTANNGGLNATGIQGPHCVFSDGTRLFVCDSDNNRVLIWNTIPTVNQTAANFVVGQPDMASNGTATTAAGMNGPFFVYVNGAKLFVSDASNNRVLVWNSIPGANGVAANFAIGQPNLTTVTANTGALSASTLNFAGAVRVDSQGRLFVSDLSNNRVLIWNQVPTVSGAAANAVIGQSDLVSSGANAGGASASSLNGPMGLDIIGSELWVADINNNRTLKYSLP